LIGDLNIFMIKVLSDNSVQLCGKGKCCPIVTLREDGTYEVKDDYGNTVLVKKEELELVADAVKTLDIKRDQLICG